MSLQVWLPLNGDLNNYGLNNATLLTNGATIVDNGKIGQCCSLNETVLYNKNFSLSTTAFSGFAWVKFTSFISKSNSYIICLNNTGTSSDCQFIFGIYSEDGTTAVLRYNVNTTGYGTLNLNTWYHVGFTYNGTKTRMYLNGEEIGSYNNPSKKTSNHLVIGGRATNAAGTAFTGSGSPGLYNDVRIYDHCLSVNEIKEISKGLMLHYKLDSIFNNKIYDISGYKNNATIIGTATFESNTPRYTQAIHMTNTSTANHIECENLSIPSDTMSISFWIKTAKATNQVLFVYHNLIEFALFNSLGYVNPAASSAGFTLTDFVNNAWNHIVVIRDGTNFYLYVNGKSATRNGANNYYTHNNTKLYLLNRSYNNNYAANATISDFRIYTTILTQDQVKELYNTSMIVSGSTIKPRDLE